GGRAVVAYGPAAGRRACGSSRASSAASRRPAESAADLRLHRSQAGRQRVATGGGRAPARGAQELAGVVTPAVAGEQRDLLDPGLVPGRAARRAGLDDPPPVAERARRVAGRRGSPGGAAQRLGGGVVLRQPLVVLLARSRRVAGG